MFVNLNPQHPGEIFDQAAYQSGQQILRLFFVNDGYARTKARRRAQVDVIRNTAQIFYTVQVGSKAYFGKTTVRGNQKVDLGIITRELVYQAGAEYSNEEIDDSRTRLLNLRLFSAVNFNPDLESAARDIPIDLNVREKESRDISIGGGYSTQDDFGAQVQWNDYNWFGGGRQMAVVVRYADINSYASVSLRQPYFLGTRQLEAGVTAVLQQEDEQTFTLNSEAIMPQLTWHYSERLSGTVTYRLMYADLNNVSSTVVDWHLGPLSINDPLGGLTDFEGSVELRHPLYKKLAGAARHSGKPPRRDLPLPAAASFDLRPGPDVSSGPDRSAADRSRIPSQAPRGIRGGNSPAASGTSSGRGDDTSLENRPTLALGLGSR